MGKRFNLFPPMNCFPPQEFLSLSLPQPALVRPLLLHIFTSYRCIFPHARNKYVFNNEKLFIYAKFVEIFPFLARSFLLHLSNVREAPFLYDACGDCIRPREIYSSLAIFQDIAIRTVADASKFITVQLKQSIYFILIYTNIHGILAYNYLLTIKYRRLPSVK